MDAKYELTGETHQGLLDCVPLHRIRALRDFGDVKRGQLGGFIESTSNLAHTGNCWVYDNAKVSSQSYVSENAQIRDNAEITGGSKIKGNAIVKNSAEISYGSIIGDSALICDKAKISSGHVTGHARISDQAHIAGGQGGQMVIVSGRAVIKDGASLYGNVHVKDHAEISEWARLYDRAKVSGYAKIFGNAKLRDRVEVGDIAQVYGNSDIQSETKIFGTTRVFIDGFITKGFFVTGKIIKRGQPLPAFVARFIRQILQLTGFGYREKAA